ncbi:MAG: Hsp20/alpha crystallin family protein [Anaerolineae bacterium]|nr:Hsp20/alpha crystallin family protein [Anaerolineae bacterium]
MSLREAMDRLFEESFVRPFGEFPSLFGDRGMMIPAVDVMEDANHITVKAELPGIKPDDIDVSVEAGVLHIRGEYHHEESDEGKHFHRRERRAGRFERALTLPGATNPDSARAEFKDGVLTLTFEKLEEAKPKRIQIRTK